MSLTNKQILELARQQKIEAARYALMPFMLYTKDNYEAGWFNELLCMELDKFLEDVEAGLMPRLMLFAPPRSGKSEVASRRFPAKVLGKHPDWNIIACSYSSDLANRMSRETQRIIDSKAYQDVYPNTRLSTGRAASSAIKTAELWEILNSNNELQGGSYRAAGVNGGITGQGMNIGIIDDPAKDYATASSATYQESVMDWYETTFYTRLDPKVNGIIIILTRWHVNDLAGQLLKKAKEEDGEKWRVVSFPMEAEKTEIHTLNGQTYRLREPGEILFPERMPRAFVNKCKALGALTWNALYQQNPQILGGELIHSEQFRRYKTLPFLAYRMIFADTAQKTEEHNDYSVFQCWGMGEDNRIYLIDQIRGKWEAPELETKAIDFWNKHRGLTTPVSGILRSMCVEDAASGTGLIQSIKRAAKAAIVPIKRGNKQSKLSRVMDILGFIEADMVCIPDPSLGLPWVSDFTTECDGFTANDSHMFDDQVDPMVDACTTMLGNMQDALTVSPEAANAFG